MSHNEDADRRAGFDIDFAQWPSIDPPLSPVEIACIRIAEAVCTSYPPNEIDALMQVIAVGIHGTTAESSSTTLGQTFCAIRQHMIDIGISTSGVELALADADALVCTRQGAPPTLDAEHLMLDADDVHALLSEEWDLDLDTSLGRVIDL